jgi:Tol biopolymer transport system component
VRLLAGGSPVPITRDPVDHQIPRWSPDGNSLVYFSPAGPDAVQGQIWSIPALGGSPRRVIDSIGGADVNKDGRLTCFRLVENDVQLVTSSLDGTNVQVIARSVAGYHAYPRWSPDGRWIAFQRGDGLRYDIFVISSGSGETRQLTHERNIIKGLAWLPDDTGIIYAASSGSTVPYLPALALWEVGMDGRTPRQLTPPEAWYEQPDLGSAGTVSAASLRMHFDIWKFPFDGTSSENTRRGVQVTHQTGQVLTPSAAPDGKDIAFLADSGGHGNLWVISTESGELRQITFEVDPTVTVGLPIWSPDGRSIAFVSSKGHTGFDFGVWLVNPDGTNLRDLASRGLGMAWSPDGKWVYYAESSAGPLYKISPSGGVAITVRSEPTRNVIGLYDTTLYYMVERPLLDGRPELEIRAATPEDGPSRAVGRIPASRVPSWQIVNPALSPDGEWLAMPLTDGLTTNIWALSTRSSTWRQVTDFGDRAIFIARRVSWSPDGRSIIASIGEGDADIVLLDGLLDRH